MRERFECVVCRLVAPLLSLSYSFAHDLRSPLDLEGAVRTRALEELNQRLSKQEADQPAAKTASWSKFSAGSRVSLTGLVARPELNGQLGHIIQVCEP